MTGEPAIVVELQESLRAELKEPLGPIFTDASELLAAAGEPLITVGDVVTYHVIETGETPDLALVDERTERSAVSEEIADTLATFEGFEAVKRVSNPPATLSKALLEAIREGMASPETTLIEVDGEEDLATLPAVLVAPSAASVVYGQPGEGMVHAVVDEEQRSTVRSILSRMEGDTELLWSVLGLED